MATKRTSHTREESRFAVYSVLLEVYKARKSGSKVALAKLCAKYHCGNLHNSVIKAVDWSKQPSYADAVAALSNNSIYKRGCKHGTRKLVKAEDVQVSEAEQRKAKEIERKIESPALPPEFDLTPDPESIFPEESMIPKAIRILKAHGYLVIEGHAL